MYLLPKTYSTMILGMMFSFMLGCNQGAVPKSTIGLIDMDLVLNKTGRLKVIEAEVLNKRNDIQSSLKYIEKGLLSSLQEKQKSFGEKPTPEQEKSLQQEGLKAQQIMQGESQKMERDFNKFLNETREKYITKEINPIIQTICQEKGYYLVVLKNQAIVHDTKIDITEDVIARMQKLPESANSLPEAPLGIPVIEDPKIEKKTSKPIPSGDIKFDPAVIAPPANSPETSNKVETPKNDDKTEPTDKKEQSKEPIIETKSEATKPADAQTEKPETKGEPQIPAIEGK